MTPNLQEARGRDQGLGRMAAWRPSTTPEAYTVWLSERRCLLVGGLDTLPVLEAERRGHQIRALGVIATELSKAIGAEITVEKRLRLRRPTSRPKDPDEEIDLFKELLAPSTKTVEKVLATLTQLFDLAEEGVIRGRSIAADGTPPSGDIPTWQALLTEVRHLRIVVENCDTAAAVVTPAPERTQYARRARPSSGPKRRTAA